MEMVGEKVSRRRSEKGLSLTELARRAGVSKSYLHSIEKGDTQSPSAEILLRIANELNTTLADLLSQPPQYESQNKGKAAEVSESLLSFAQKYRLPEVDILMLAGIEYRGKQPATEQDWQFLYESIKRSVR